VSSARGLAGKLDQPGLGREQHLGAALDRACVQATETPHAHARRREERVALRRRIGREPRDVAAAVRVFERRLERDLALEGERGLGRRRRGCGRGFDGQRALTRLAKLDARCERA
jgi:hypothetical protein